MVTVVLVFACGLIVRSFNGLWNVDRGFRSEGLLSVRPTPNPGGYQDFNQAAYYPALVEQLATLPGVQSVGFARYFGTINSQLPPQPVGFVEASESASSGVLEYISPRFFVTAGIPLLSGRDVTWTDSPTGPPVAVVSESLARALSPDGDVVGRVIRFGTSTETSRLQIIGVAGNVSLGNFRDTLVISCAGLFALLSHSVSRRTREIGIRVAVGATPAAVSWMIVRDALFLVFAGLALGVPAAIGSTSVVRSLLFGVTTTDGLTLAVSVILLIATGVIASVRPAAQAVRLDPSTALRAD